METTPVVESILHQLSEEQHKQKHNNMATINYPLTKTVLSAEGSAEVIAYGSNDYTAKWSIDTDSNWSLWDTFPTVVRFGNFVYCWHKTNGSGSNTHTYYILIDVVEDPSSNKELGRNIAYPELSNTKTDKIENISTGKATVGDLTDGPYNPLLIGDKVVKGFSPAAGFPSATDNTIKYITPVFTNGAITTAHIGGYNAAGSDIHRIRGWGDISTRKGTNGDTAYGLFAPFATQAQFETVYGKEHNWQSPASSSQVWLFEAEAGSASNVYAAALTYPFTVEAMVPNTLYRDIPGDTTGDGIDNTPSFETALAALGTVAAVVPALDPTKCVGFPGDIKIPGIATDGISERLNEAKAAVAAAASSAGLLDIEKNLESLKASIEDSLPKGAQIQNLAADIAGVDPDDFNAIDTLNEKWKGAVDNVAGYFDDIGGLDICSLVGLEGKTGDDGSLVKKPELPSIPERDIEEPGQSSVVSTQSKNTVQNEVGAATGLTPAKYEQAYDDWYDLWTELRNDDAYIWADYFRRGPAQWEKLQEIVKGPDYVTARLYHNSKETIPLTKARMDEMRAELMPVGLFAFPYIRMKEMITFYQIYLQENIRNMREGSFFPTPDYEINDFIIWEDDTIAPVGAIFEGDNSLNISFMDQANFDLLSKLKGQLASAIKRYFFSEEGINIQLIFMAQWSAFINDPKEKQKIIDALNEGSEGDPVDDSIDGTPTDEFKNVVPGNVSYTSGFSGKIRNKPIQPKLMKILEASAAEKNYSLVIYSGGQDYIGQGTRREGSKRHDGGYAADMRVYNDKGRRIHAASRSSKDIDALRDFVLVLLKNGIGSIGADDDYMTGNLHVDIAHLGPHKITKACWGAKNKDYSRIHAPQWLTSAFDNRV